MIKGCLDAVVHSGAGRRHKIQVFTNEHIPVSVSVADSLTEELRCYVNDDPKMLLTDMFEYIGSVSMKVQQYNVHKYKSLLQKTLNPPGLTGMEIPGATLGNTYKIPDVSGWIKEGEYACFFDFHSVLGFGKQRSDYGRVKQQLDQVLVFGFNSGRYDINLIKKDLFAVIGTDDIKSVIKNPSYMCIATSDMKMLDISNYVPAGTSYDKYLTTYLGGCKCDDKIRSFHSDLRGTSISDDDYKRVQFVWGHYGMKSFKDLLIWYNNLDVVPFIKAIKAQRDVVLRLSWEWTCRLPPQFQTSSISSLASDPSAESSKLTERSVIGAKCGVIKAAFGSSPRVPPDSIIALLVPLNVTEAEMQNVTPRIKIATHRPLGQIKAFSVLRNKTENSMQWLRALVYEMKGTRASPDEWCMPFELSLRDGALHWYRQLSKKTKRQWSLLSEAFIKYNCSQFNQSAESRYYSAKRDDKEHICDYLNRLTGSDVAESTHRVT
ncbi:unnamed protein product [Phytophthora lilii]|uniref:Unnamed protein product n=1 Tax=Phytophthora lilii TaxID=2077276 RepID=A0A9W7CV72_9STRA|nr:unnamed protein product [Phytophthora lilii]